MAKFKENGKLKLLIYMQITNRLNRTTKNAFLQTNR